MIPCTSSINSETFITDNRSQVSSSSIVEDKNQSKAEDLKKHLEQEKIINSEGLLTTQLKDKNLPELEVVQQNLILQLLELPLSLSIENYQATTNLSVILNAIKEYFKLRNWPAPQVEIIGGYVRWLILQSTEFCKKIIQQLGSSAFENFNDTYLSKLANYPPDYDIRIYTPSSANEDDLNALIDIVVNCLAKAMSSENTFEIKKLIYQQGLKKKFVPFDNRNKYGVISFGSCPKGSSAEILFVKELKREFTFTHTAPKLFKREDKWQLISSGDFCWQGVIDLLTRQIHAHSPQTLDHQVWALYHSYITKGYTSVEPLLVSKLVSRILPPHKPAETLVRCLSNHHQNSISDLVALCINTYFSDTTVAQAVWEMRSQLPLKKSENANRHPLELVSDYAQDFSFTLHFITVLYQIAVLMDTSSKKVEHKKALCIQISFQDKVYLLLPYEPKKALDNLKQLFPQKIDNAQQKKLQHLLDSLFVWDSAITHHELDSSILTYGFEFLESKELLIRRVGYQLLLHYYKYQPDERILRQLLIRFPEIFINLSLNKHALFFECLQSILQGGFYKIPDLLFSCEQVLLSNPQNPQIVLNNWLIALASSYDPLLIESAYSIWLNCTTKMTPEIKLSLGTTLINSLGGFNVEFCTNVLHHLCAVVQDSEIVIPLVEKILNRCSKQTDISILLSFKSILQKIKHNLKKDLPTQQLINLFLAKGYVEEAQTLLKEISDETMRDIERVSCTAMEFNQAIKADQWEKAGVKSLYLLRYSNYFENEKEALLSLLLNSLHLKPDLALELLEETISMAFLDSESTDKGLSLAWIRTFLKISVHYREKNLNYSKKLCLRLLDNLKGILNVLEKEGLVDEAYFFIREIERNKIPFSLTNKHISFCFWLFKNLLAVKNNEADVIDLLNTLLLKFVEADIATTETLPMVIKVVNYNIALKNYERACQWIEKLLNTSIIETPAKDLILCIKSLVFAVEFDWIASILIDHKEFFAGSLGICKDTVEDIVTLCSSDSRFKGNEVLLLSLLTTYSISSPSLWKNIYSLIAQSNNPQSKKILWSTLIEYVDGRLFIEAHEECAACWLAALKSGGNFDKNSLLLLPSKNSLAKIFDSSQSQVIILEGYKWVFYHLLTGNKKEEIIEKGLIIFNAFKDKHGSEQVDKLISELLSFKKFHIEEFLCKWFVNTVPNESITYVQLFQIISIAQILIKNNYEIDDLGPFFKFIKEYISWFKSYPEAFGIMGLLLKRSTKASIDLLEEYITTTLNDVENDIVCEYQTPVVEKVISHLTLHAETTEGVEKILYCPAIKAYLSQDVLAQKWNNLLIKCLNEGIDNENFDFKVIVWSKCLQNYSNIKSIPVNNEFFKLLAELLVQIEYFSTINYQILGEHLTGFCRKICVDLRSVPFFENHIMRSYAILNWPSQHEEMSEVTKAYQLYVYFLKATFKLDNIDDNLKFIFRQYCSLLIQNMMNNTYWMNENLDLLEYFSLHGDKLFKDMMVHEKLVIKAFSLVYSKKNYLSYKKRFFTIAHSFGNERALLSSEEVGVEPDVSNELPTPIFSKGFLPINEEKKIILDVVINFISKDYLLYQIKGMRLFYKYLTRYGSPDDHVNIRMIFDKFNICLKNTHPIYVDSLMDCSLNILLSIQKKFIDDWWQEYVISIYRRLINTVLEIYPVFASIPDAETFILSMNNILNYSYYKTSFIKNYPHAIYDFIETLLHKIEKVEYSEDDNFRDFLVVLMRELVDLNCTEITDIYKEEVRQFVLLKKPKSYAIMKKIAPVDRIPFHGRGARTLWLKCFSMCGELLIRLYSKTEKTTLNQVFQGYLATAMESNDNDFKKESQRLLSLFFSKSE